MCVPAMVPMGPRLMGNMSSEAEFMVKAYPARMEMKYFLERKPTVGFRLLDEADLKGKYILDIGAFAGYVGWYCQQKGATAIITDIFCTAMPTFLMGMVADKEHLQFKDGTFDFVVCNDVLHHGDLMQTGREARRVLKEGGIFISTQEPCISSLESEETVLRKDCAEQVAAGIDERRPNIKQYTEFCMLFREWKIHACHDWSPARDLNYGGDGVAIWCRK